jgi:hypothetical protein
MYGIVDTFKWNWNFKIERIIYVIAKQEKDIKIVHMTQYNQMTKVSWFCDSGLKLSRMYKEYSKFVKMHSYVVD